MSAILEVENLSKHYGGFTLQDVSFTVEQGTVMGFIGPNGAGKSTVIKLIMNLIRRDGGQIRIFGQDNLQHEQRIKDRIGFVYDESVFYESLTVAQTGRLLAPFYSKWDDGRYGELIRQFQLPAGQKVKELSKGMKMKLSLAVALAHGAELLVMDEPTAGLDPLVRSEMLALLRRELEDERKAVFFSTHITSDLDKIADTVTMLNGGRLIVSAAKDDLLDGYGIVKGPNELIGSTPPPVFIGVRRNAFGFEALARSREECRRLYGSQITVERPTLEDVLLYHIGRNE